MAKPAQPLAVRSLPHPKDLEKKYLKLLAGTAQNQRFFKSVRPPSRARTVGTQRRHQLDLAALRQHVQDEPEARLKDRAPVLGVHHSAIGHALQRHDITVKKIPLPPA